MGPASIRDRRLALVTVVLGASWLASAALAVQPEQPAPRRATPLSLSQAVLQALEHNLDITISRQTRDVRLTDIVFEQAKFDPTMNLSMKYERLVDPLNRPIFGFGEGATLTEPRPFDQNETTLDLALKQKLRTGANYDVTFNPERTFVSGPNTFLFNEVYTSALKLNLSQPLLRDRGVDVNLTPIRIAQNNAKVESYVFLDRVLTVTSAVEQAYWEMVFTNENLKVAQTALSAAEELLVSNRAMAKAGVIADVEVLQAEAGVASRIEQILVAEKAIKDQEDQVRQLLNPSEQDLMQDTRLVPVDKPVQALQPISLEMAKDIAIQKRPEVLQALKRTESSGLNVKFAKNQILPSLSFEGTVGLSGLGKGPGDMLDRNLGGNFYNYGMGLVLSYPLGNRSAWSQYNKRQLEARNAEAELERVRKQIIVDVKEAVRRVQTDFKRIETTQSARILAEKQVEAEEERLRSGLSTTVFVLGFQRDLAVARANELRAIVDYNKSLSNLARQKATTLEGYKITIE